MTASFPAPASRNAPCPCGSGRRYKDCHGNIVSIAAASAASESPAHGAAFDFDALMQRALAAQQSGRLSDAVADYQSALALAPDHFDALHMLGVTLYQLDDFERAEPLLRRAIEVDPSIRDAHRNLRLLQHARHLRDREDALCRSVMPKLARHCMPALSWTDLCARAMPAVVDILIAETDASAVSVAQRLMAPLTPTLWAVGPDERQSLGDAGLRGVRTPGESPRSGPQAEVRVLLGTSVPLAWWGALDPAATVALVVDRAAPSTLHDRVREMSEEGRRLIHVLYATEELRAGTALPGAVLH